MGLDRRNWRKPYTEDELKSMLAAGEMLQLRQRVQELEKERNSADKIADHYRAERDELLATIESHAPHGRNFTNEQVVKLTAERDELLAAAIKAADEIRKCDYTPARSTLLVAIASVKEK